MSEIPDSLRKSMSDYTKSMTEEEQETFLLRIVAREKVDKSYDRPGFSMTHLFGGQPEYVICKDCSALVQDKAEYTDNHKEWHDSYHQLVQRVYVG